MGEDGAAGQKWEEISDQLISDIYATTLSPEHYDQFMESVEAYLYNLRAKNPGPGEAPVDRHFKTALTLLDVLGRKKSSGDRAFAIAESAPGPAIILDDQLTITALNNAARGATRSNAPKLSDFGLDDDALSDIQIDVHDLTKDDNLRVVPLKGSWRDQDGCLLLSKVNIDSEHLESGVRYLLTFSDFSLNPEQRKVLRKAYNLSDVEIDIAFALMKGLTVQEIAGQRKKSVNTLRTQIKSIQKKTETNSIADIIRLFGALLANLTTMLQHSDLPATGKSAPNVPLRRNTLTVRDGRRLAYIEQGAVEGIPVLFAHNMMYGVEWTPSALFAAEKRNIRIIAPSRPGFGFSDPLPGQDIDTVLDSAAADYCEVMDHLNIERAIIFGHGMASIYALRFARRYPHRVQALMAASHAPIWKDKWLKELPVRQRQVYTVARYAPQLLPFITRAGAALIRSGNHDRFIDALTWNIPADIKAMKNKEAYDVMVRALHHTINQGCEAYCRECIIRSRDYVDEAQKLTMPMHILHGLGDVMVPPSRVELFCERVPESQVTWVENAGQYLLFTHWQHVLRKIEELA